MIIDAHTHLFSNKQINDRKSLINYDKNFEEIYSNPDAKMATAEDLLESMDVAKIDMSVIMGFQWSEEKQYDLQARYLIDQQKKYPNKFICFPPLSINNFNEINMKIEDMYKAGAKGFGEIRINQEFNEKILLNKILPEILHSIKMFNLKVNFHTTESIGHTYPGKENGLTLSIIWDILNSNNFDESNIIAAHFGAGLPVYQFMPVVKKKIQDSNIHFDTAAFNYLYDPYILQITLELLGVEKFFWGSDYPLIQQSEDLTLMKNLDINNNVLDAILGKNFVKYMNLS